MFKYCSSGLCYLFAKGRATQSISLVESEVVVAVLLPFDGHTSPNGGVWAVVALSRVPAWIDV